MDQRDRSVPPGVGPRLPDPPTPAPKKRNNREPIILGAAGLLLAALATWFIVFVLGSAKTPAQAVAGALDEGFTVQQELAQVSLPASATERSVYFFVSNDALACAVLQRKPSGYKVLSVSGHLPLTSADKPGIWMAPNLGDDEFFLYGMLYDDALRSVEVEGVPAVIVDTGVYRCWYYLGEGAMSINSESVVYK